MVFMFNESYNTTGADISEQTPLFQRLEEGLGIPDFHTESDEEGQPKDATKAAPRRFARRVILVCCCIFVALLLMAAVAVFLKNRQASRGRDVDVGHKTEMRSFTVHTASADPNLPRGAVVTTTSFPVSTLVRGGPADSDSADAGELDGATQDEGMEHELAAEEEFPTDIHTPEDAEDMSSSPATVGQTDSTKTSEETACQGWYINTGGFYTYFILISHPLQEKLTAKTARIRAHGQKVNYEERFRCETRNAVSRVDTTGMPLSQLGEYRLLTEREVHDLPGEVMDILTSIDTKKQESEWHSALTHYNDGAAELEEGTVAPYWQINPTPETRILEGAEKMSIIDAHVADLTPEAGVQALATFLKFGTEEKNEYDASSEFCDTIRGSESGGWKWFLSRQHKSLRNFATGQEHADYNINNDYSRAVVEMSLFKSAFGARDADQELPQGSSGSRIPKSEEWRKRFYRDVRVLPMEKGMPLHEESCASPDFIDVMPSQKEVSYNIFITEYQGKEIEFTDEAKGMAERLFKKKFHDDAVDEVLSQLPTHVRPPVLAHGLMVCAEVDGGFASPDSNLPGCDDSGESSCLACTEIAYDLREQNFEGVQEKRGGLLVEKEIGRRGGTFDSVKRVIKIANAVTCQDLIKVWWSLPLKKRRESPHQGVESSSDSRDSRKSMAAGKQELHVFVDEEFWNPLHHNGDTFVKVFSDALDTTTRDAHGIGNVFPYLKNCVKALQAVAIDSMFPEIEKRMGTSWMTRMESRANGVVHELQTCGASGNVACIEDAFDQVIVSADDEEVASDDAARGVSHGGAGGGVGFLEMFDKSKMFGQPVIPGQQVGQYGPYEQPEPVLVQPVVEQPMHGQPVDGNQPPLVRKGPAPKIRCP